MIARIEAIPAPSHPSEPTPPAVVYSPSRGGMKLSQRASRIAQSEIRVMSVECERVKGVNLAQGICDTEVPEPVRRGAHEAIESGRNQYTRLDGIAELRRAIARKMQRYNGVTC